MKKITSYLVLSLMICLTGCTKKEEKPVTITPPVTTPVPTQTEKKEEPVKPIEEKKESENKEIRDKSGAIRVNFPAGTTIVNLKGKINGLQDKITYVVEAKKNQIILIKVIAAEPEKNPDANIRIEKLIRPSGTSEGPFGVKIKYDLDEAGDWKIVLSGDETAGKSWKGEYNLMITLN